MVDTHTLHSRNSLSPSLSLSLTTMPMHAVVLLASLFLSLSRTLSRTLSRPMTRNLQGEFAHRTGSEESLRTPIHTQNYFRAALVRHRATTTRKAIVSKAPFLRQRPPRNHITPARRGALAHALALRYIALRHATT